jgi:alkylhydroperoxidase/carboxymuconolactone decarboxylase family protein YurZ
MTIEPTNGAPAPQTAAEVREALAGLRAKRGYLLPHHGLMAVAAPQLLAAYDATYTALTLTPRVFTEHEKELVWLIILVSTGEAIATHHIDRLRRAGGDDRQLEATLALAAWGEGASRFAFVGAHWGPHLPEYDAVAAYRRGLDALLAAHPLDRAVAEMGLAAAHQCHRRWDWLREHIRGAYAAGADERAIAEALSLAMFPGGVPNFVDACHHWRELIVAGEVAASPPFRAWAEMTGQGGFDEAAGLRG